MNFPKPPNEAERLKALRELRVLDTPCEPHFEAITRLAARSFNVPAALISLIDAERQWFKASCGVGESETPRELAFCAHTILSDEILVIEDATQDPRVCQNPFVTGEANIRFYAGAPLVLRPGICLGTLCVVDTRPRTFSPEEHQTLQDLASVVVAQLRLYETKAELEEKAALLAATLEHMDQGLLMFDSSETIQVYNSRAVELLGFSKEFLEQRPTFRQLVSHQVRTGEFVKGGEALRRYADGIIETRHAYERERPDGSVLEIRTVPLAGGGAVRTYADVTQRKHTEAQLRQSEARYRALITASASIVWQSDPQGRTLDIAGWWEFTGQSPESAHGLGWLEAVHPADRDQVVAAWHRILASGLPGDNRYRIRRADGAYRWCVARTVPLRDEVDEIIAWVGTVTDIHEHRTAQEDLKRSEERLRLATEATGFGTYSIDLTTGERAWSREMHSILGLKPEDPIDRDSFRALIHPDDRAWVEAEFERKTADVAGPVQMQYRIIPNGQRQVRWVAEFSRTLCDAGGEPTRVVGTLRDITSEKEAELAVRESERRLSTLLGNLPGFAYRCRYSPDWLMEYISEGVRGIVGYSPQDLCQPEGPSWAEIIHPDDQERVWKEVQQAVNERRSFELTYRVRTTAGEERWVWERGQGLVSSAGEVEVLEGFVTDVTKQRMTEEQLRQSQKMEAVGQLTGGIAHDFNNLLTVILGNAELLTEEPSDPALTYTLAQQILETAERGADLNQKLLAFGRRQSLKPERLKAETVVNEMVPLLYRTIGEHIELRTEHGATQYCALTDRTLLESAVLNLAVNARDAMPRGGMLTIETGERLAGQGDGSLPIGQPVVYVCVSDTGTGMTPEVLKRVFEPFFTTKDTGKGSGLGLSMVVGFAEQSAGHVSIESKVGEGTTVTIVLPGILAGTLPATHEDTKAPTAGPRGAKVLLVEDEQPVLEYVSGQLTSLGYQVTAVSTGREALDLLQQVQCFDLLFTDVVLPKGLSGVQVAQRASQLCPQIKVLLTSGYPEEVFQQHGTLPDDTILLRKPYRRKELERILAVTLTTAA